MRRAISLAIILFSGCTGTIGDGPIVEEDVPLGPELDAGGFDAGPTDPGVVVCGDYPHLLRRLTRVHYEQMVERMFPGVELPPLDIPALFSTDYDYDNDATRSAPTPETVSRYAAVASQIGTAALNSSELWMPCPADSQECVEQTALRLANLAWRRPLDIEEVEALQAFVAARSAASSPREALESVIPVLLESVDFLYFTEVGDEEEAAPEGMRALLPHELAQRLSLFFWDQPADDALVAQVAALESEDYGAFVDRMFDDARSVRGIDRFASQWMPLSAGRLDGKFPTELMNELGVELSGSAHAAFRETLRLAALTLARQAFTTGTMRDLFGGSSGYVNDVIAPIYGLEPVGSADALVRVEFDPSERAGILTEPAVLADAPRGTRFPSIFRAIMILSQVTCEDPGQPNFASIQTRVDGEAGPVSLRRQLEEGHLASGCGGSCHTIIDNLGFPFNRYDEHGRYQTTETYNYTAPGGAEEQVSFDIDASGTLYEENDEGELEARASFENASDLAQQLAEFPVVHRCVTEHLYRYALGRSSLEDADRQRIADIASRFGADDPLRDLSAAVVNSEAFRYMPACESGEAVPTPPSTCDDALFPHGVER